MRVQASRMGSEDPVGTNGSPRIREVMRSAPRAGYSVIPDFQEKPRTEPLWCPYRKPTQVGGVSIPRRVREPWRRCAGLREELRVRSVGWLQRNGGCDCLLKTQDSANSKEDV
jgi:hypothetical protein